MVVDDTLAARREDTAANHDLIQVDHVFGLSRSDLSSLLGVSADRFDAPRTWSPRSRTKLRRLAALADRLQDTFEPASIQAWLHAPSRDLQWRIPIDLLRDGQLDSVDAALEAIDSGVFV